MAKNTNINVRTTVEVKKRAEVILNDLGLNLSSAVNLFLKQVINYRGIPFDLRLPNKATMKAMDDVDNRRDLSAADTTLLAAFCHKFNSVKSTCFKVISQGFLDDAKAWFETGNNVSHLWLMYLQIRQDKYTLFLALIYFGQRASSHTSVKRLIYCRLVLPILKFRAVWRRVVIVRPIF